MNRDRTKPDTRRAVSRHLAALAALLPLGAACDNPAVPVTVRDSVDRDADDGADEPDTPDTPPADSASPEVDTPEVTGPDPVLCVWIPSVGEHRECHHMAAGECAAWGTWCGSECMYIPTLDEYRACHHAPAGACVSWGTWCEPECMFIAELGEYRECHHGVAGECAAWGTWCEPEPTRPP